jgi:hypothetical protein
VACPVAAYRVWIEAADIGVGPVFRPNAKGERLRAARLTGRRMAQKGEC